MTLSALPQSLTLFAIYAVYGTTFGLAGGSKLLGKTVPEWFTSQFAKTFLNNFPGIPTAYWTITLLECAVPVLLIISLVKGECCPSQDPTFLALAVALAAIVFGILGFGLRLVNDFQGAANSFFYFAAALVTQIYIQKILRS